MRMTRQYLQVDAEVVVGKGAEHVAGGTGHEQRVPIGMRFSTAWRQRLHERRHVGRDDDTRGARLGR